MIYMWSTNMVAALHNNWTSNASYCIDPSSIYCMIHVYGTCRRAQTSYSARLGR